jgi:hypothetical protein
VSFVEAILENPGVVLEAQASKLRDELFQKLKADGVEFDERMAELEKVTYPKPAADLIYQTFNEYSVHHPWIGSENIRPKSVVRDMYERYVSFNDYVKEYGIARAEGALLRYLSEAYKAIVQTVPERYWTEELIDITAFLRSALQRVDSSLVEEWERMLDSEASRAPEQRAERVHELARDPRLLRSRIRHELHILVQALAARDYEQAADSVRAPAPGGDGEPWTVERFEHALGPFFAQYEQLIADHRARQTQWTILEEQAPRLYRVRQVLLDPAEDNQWYLEGTVDLRAGEPDGPLIELRELGS